MTISIRTIPVASNVTAYNVIDEDALILIVDGRQVKLPADEALRLADYIYGKFSPPVANGQEGATEGEL